MGMEGIRRTALELGVYLPIGAALAARDLLVSRGRLAELLEELVDRGREGLGGLGGGGDGGLERITLEVLGDEGALEEEATPPATEQLPIQGYDQLTARELVRRLTGLSQAELQLVRDYEARTKSRATVLERIDGLTR